MRDPYDLLVIGGGINGAGIARDAAGRGLRVALVEAKDLGCATSSASTKLIHGGLRYLEQGAFGLVRKALLERATLLRIAPHITKSLDFILPHHNTIRPEWLIRLGLFLYDALAFGTDHPTSQRVSLEYPVKQQFPRGFRYMDGWVDDARLVVLNAVDAAERGADVFTYTAVSKLGIEGAFWAVQLSNETTLYAKNVVNAAGPWVNAIERPNLSHRLPLRFVKGSHIIVPKLYSGDHAYILQNHDGRIVFTIPYEGEYTLVGTTDIPYDGDPYAAHIDAQEIDYLIAAVNTYFDRPVDAHMVRYTYAGVRPLLDDGKKNVSKTTRDYKLVMEGTAQHPLLTVYGGKITTYRVLAEQALARLGIGGSRWTHRDPLPGGDFESLSVLQTNLFARYPDVPPSTLSRYARLYGTRTHVLLKDGKGMEIASGLFSTEIDYLVRHEFARTVEDILWRRTKLGLHTAVMEQEAIEKYLLSKQL